MTGTHRMRGFAAVAVWTVLAVPAGAATIQVPGDQPTIQAAINAAVAGDEVVVAPGTYTENINFQGKAITVRSAAGPAVTIIDGQRLGPVVKFATGEGRSSVLRGFTLRNGRVDASSPDIEGGGIRISQASPQIINNVITANQACAGGGGVSVSFGSPLISSNTISGNSQFGCSGGTGGGIQVNGSGSTEIVNNKITGNSFGFGGGGGVALNAAGTAVLSNNLISGNTSSGEGGGVRISNASSVLIRQNVIVENTATRGSGIAWIVPSGSRGPRLVNNTIAANHATASPYVSGIYADGFDGQVELVNNVIYAKAGMIALSCGTSIGASSVPVLRNNDVQNAGGSGSPYAGSCPDQTGVNGNLKVDPGFNASVPYTLLSSSPLRDAGDSTQTDILLTDFGNGKRVYVPSGTALIDIGADEYESVP